MRMYTMKSFKEFLIENMEQPFGSAVVPYTDLMECHEYHMMKFLMLDDDLKRDASKATETSKDYMYRYFKLGWRAAADWDWGTVMSDEVIGAILYAHLELLDVVWSGIRFTHERRVFQVSEYLYVIDDRHDYKADLVREYAAEAKYHKPHIMVFDTPYTWSDTKFQMRLFRKRVGRQAMGWFLYCPYNSHHVPRWMPHLDPNYTRAFMIDTLPEWIKTTGQLFRDAPEWYKTIKRTSDPAHFAEEPIRPRGATIFEPQRLIRNKKDE